MSARFTGRQARMLHNMGAKMFAGTSGDEQRIKLNLLVEGYGFSELQAKKWLKEHGEGSVLLRISD